MSIYPELLSNNIRIIDGVEYNVRKFGLNNKVYEEELIPIPSVKKHTFLKLDGSKDIAKSFEENL